jgi:hypothetical protein
VKKGGKKRLEEKRFSSKGLLGRYQGKSHASSKQKNNSPSRSASKRAKKEAKAKEAEIDPHEPRFLEVTETRPISKREHDLRARKQR